MYCICRDQQFYLSINTEKVISFFDKAEQAPDESAANANSEQKQNDKTVVLDSERAQGPSIELIEDDVIDDNQDETKDNAVKEESVYVDSARSKSGFKSNSAVDKIMGTGRCKNLSKRLAKYI